jgi:hypothetical protein
MGAEQKMEMVKEEQSRHRYGVEIAPIVDLQNNDPGGKSPFMST